MTFAEITTLLWGTVVYRPYVYAFLSVFLVFAVLQLGAARAATFAVTTWALAFAAEYSSTRNGFPFGFYRYFDETRGRELWISNVPFWDSLSFVFLSYFSFAVAAALLSSPADRARGSWSGLGHPAAPLVGGALMMLLDVVIDPVALQGEKWFLGRIYEYPHRGFYFGVTAANFAGWLLVGAASQWVFQRCVAALPWCRAPWRRLPASFAWAVLAVYASVFLFDVAVTIMIGDHALALASSAVTLATVGIVAARLRGPRAGSIVVCAATGTEAAACLEGIADSGVEGVEVLRTGVGPERAARALRERLAAEPRPTLVVSSGFAGALTPGLERGSFVTADAVIELVDGRSSAVAIPPGGLRTAPASAPVSVVSASTVLQSAPAGSGGAAAADMESAALARIAAGANVPFAVFRVVSDTPAAPLPELARSAAAALA
ncbi:MAG TPA: carotenoid biosynthesis protein, partial [Anaeromyxobacteraceae bacterium]|nr:carotenoid biosynthesis protein [Anaeromyxobacteraceae bacterium]